MGLEGPMNEIPRHVRGFFLPQMFGFEIILLKLFAKTLREKTTFSLFVAS
jgi:hypothetical protein